MPKINRNGQAAALTPDQLTEVFDELRPPHQLIFQIAYYTAARIGEVVRLRVGDILGGYVVYRAANTKTKQTRSVAIAPPLERAIAQADLPSAGYLFPGRKTGHLTTRACDKALRNVLDYVGIKGASTHSFRRSLLTLLHFEKGYSLRTLQQITKHQDIGNLARYLEIGQQEADQALLTAWE